MFPRLYPDGQLTNLAYGAVADALALASLQRDGRAFAVLCWPEELPADPTATFAAAAGCGRTLLWHGDEWLLGLGSAATIDASGPGRALAIARASADLEARCVIVAPQGAPTLPVLLHAVAFADHAIRDSHWGHHLPGQRLVLPRRLLWRRGNQGWIIAALAVTADDGEPHEVFPRLLAAPMPQPVAQPAPWAKLRNDLPALIDDALGLLRDGVLRKVVVARADDVPADAVEAILPRLRALADAGTTVYAHDLDDDGCFVGATPETLFDADGDTLRTVALAGSAARGNGKQDDRAIGAALLASTKERKEHQLVVEHIVGALRPRCAPFAVPPTPGIRALSRILHLETPIAATLTQRDYADVLNALLPTPAVCGLPNHLALNWLARHEHLDRGLYAGALGFSTPAQCRFAVPLRGAIVRAGRDGQDNAARCFAGAGLVETSDPQTEIAEIELKLAGIRAAMRGTDA